MGCGASSDATLSKEVGTGLAGSPDTSSVPAAADATSDPSGVPEVAVLPAAVLTANNKMSEREVVDILTEIKDGHSESKDKAMVLIQKTFRGLLGRNRTKKMKLWKAWNELEFLEEKEQGQSYELYKRLKQVFVEKQTGGNLDAHLDIKEHEDGEDTGLTEDLNMDAKLLEAMSAVRSKHQLARTLKKRSSSINKQKMAALAASRTGPELSCLNLVDRKMSFQFVMQMMEDFNDGKQLKSACAKKIVQEVAPMFRKLPNVVPVHIGSQIKLTVVGDIHGQLADLLTIFKLNGLPAVHNHYLFNGDIVDRGESSMECILLIFALKLLFPESILINRGNHECEDMVSKHGFERECLKKYDHEMFGLIVKAFMSLPICTVIEGKVLVVHGGVPQTDGVTLAAIDKIDRFVPMLEPFSVMEDLMWSDPRNIIGRKESSRGAGCLFGAKVCSRFLKNNNLELLVRSHECVDDGFQPWFNERCITIFSASNYCQVMENAGAFMLFDKSLSPTVVTFSAFEHDKLHSALASVSSGMETEIAQKLVVRIARSRLDLLAYFQKTHPNDNYITRAEWSLGLQSVLNMNLPFLLFQSRLGLPVLGIKGKPKGPIDYVEFLAQFESIQIGFLRKKVLSNEAVEEDSKGDLSVQDEEFMFSDIVRQASEITNNISALFQLLYRHREQLDSLFRFFDTDGSGEVSIDEMVDAMKVLVSILDTELVISDEDLRGFAVGLDKNDDGNVDYDEFFDLFATLDEAYSISSDNQHEHGIHRTTSLNKVRSIDKMLDHAISSSKDRDTLKPKKIANIHPDDFKPLDKISIAQHDELVNHAASVMSIDVDAAQADHPVPNSSANTPIERNVTIDFKTLD